MSKLHQGIEMIGLAILAFGAVLLWAAFTKRGDAVLNALGVSLPAPDPPQQSIADAGGGSGGGGGSHSGGNPDSGSHAGLLPDGTIINIDKPYADMTDAEKDAANDYAHQIGNG